MLAHLHIQNVGLIEHCQVDFKEGFTIITGETGAGKSMLIDALSLGLGARADTSLIRHGAEKASVEVRFQIPKKHPVLYILAEFDLDLEDGELFLRRTLSKDKSRGFVNGSQVTQAQLRQLGETLVDIHGQYDGQQLLKPSGHVHMLDQFGHLNKECQAVKNAYSLWSQSNQKLQEAQTRLKNQADEQILLTAYIDELEKLNLEDGEEESLVQERKVLMSSEKLAGSLSEALAILSGDGVDISGALSRAESALTPLGEMSGNMGELCERFSSVSLEVSELMHDLERLGTDLEANPERLKEVDDRLFTLKDVARKHDVQVNELSQKLADMQEKLAQLDNLQEDLSILEKEVSKHRKTFEDACLVLSKARQKASALLSKAVEESLVLLEMPETKFAAYLNPLEPENWTEKGAEKVEFMVATNKGQPLAPLVKVASGGEVSRLMLALKQVFYKDIAPTTLVFDEIDTGVGGHVAEAMGLAMKNLSGTHQVFSITHLAQVASKGHRHVKISKSSDTEVTRTSLVELGESDRLDEVSRMISGREITGEAKAAAAKLLA